MRQVRPADGRERGQIMILFVLALVVILGFASLVVDLGLLRNDRQILVNTLDAGALAGGTVLPVTGATEATAATKLINDTIKANFPGLPSSAYKIEYKCLIGVVNGAPAVARDVPLTCNPTQGTGHTSVTQVVAADFVGAGPTRVSACRPDLGDKCNVVQVTGSATRQFGFGAVVGVQSGSTGAVTSTACQGPCGDPPTVPVDLVVIIDRTASMSAADVTATRDAAKAVLSVYDPNIQRVGLGLLGPSVTTSTCSGSPSGVYGKAMTSSTGYGTSTSSDLREWIPVGLSGAGAPSPGFNELYKNADGTLNTSSHLVAAINCFDNPGGTGTNLAVPIRMAAYYLNTYGRAGVKKGIILETDGQPNYGVGTASDYTCAQADIDATNAKAAKIEIFTVGFGLDGTNNVACPDTSGAFVGKKVTYLLASMATQTPPAIDNLCVPAENTDGDHFFCEPKTSDLSSVFATVAVNFARGGAFLLNPYPVPVVTAVSPTSGTDLGGTSVTITGKYFTGATSVRFGGTAATGFSVASDTSITATAPAGTTGATADITVTTPGGTSPQVSADRFTYN